MNQRIDLLLQYPHLEKLLALVATHLKVNPVKIELAPIAKVHNSSFWGIVSKPACKCPHIA
jgi:hypothetical protein